MRVQRFPVEGVGDVMHSHDADSEACLNRQIFSNSIKKESSGRLVLKTVQTDAQRTTKPVLGFCHL